VNSLNLTGRLTKDPELRSMPDNRPVCELRIAVDAPGDNSPLYLDIATFDKQAQACAQYLSKGREIAFSGRLVYREWTADDGSRRSKHSAIGRVEFIGPRPNGSQPAGQQAQPQSQPQTAPEPQAAPQPQPEQPVQPAPAEPQVPQEVPAAGQPPVETPAAA
jgi:single-strand DNA-binding protein